MQDFEDNLFDIFDDDGDEAVEMCLCFDDNDKGGGRDKIPSGKSGCCVVVLIGIGASLAGIAWVLPIYRSEKTSFHVYTEQAA